MEKMESPYGSLQLRRWPVKKNDNLRAWDAADELILQHLAQQNLLPDKCQVRVLLVNDDCGALSCSLHQWQPVNWSDSSISHRAMLENMKFNSLAGPVQTIKSCDDPQGQFDIVLVKVPKATAMLEDQLLRLRPCLHSGSRVIAAAMVKHLPPSASAVVEKVIGPTSTSLAVKKARLIFSTPDPSLPMPTNPYPTRYTDEVLGFELGNHASLFSRDRLDAGAALLLSQYAALPKAARVVDLGCGNGVLGIMYQHRHHQARVSFIDESYMAVASAQSNWQDCFPDLRGACFEAANGLTEASPESVDLVLCNPPFHQRHALDRSTAQSLFHDSKRCLTRGGELWVVANRHLGYHVSLRRLFGNCATVASTRKFVVLRARKRHGAAGR